MPTKLPFYTLYSLYQLAISSVYLWFGVLALYHKCRYRLNPNEERTAQLKYTLQKLGFLPKPLLSKTYTAWIHGCSAGEINSAEEVLRLIHLNLQKHTKKNKNTQKKEATTLPGILITYQSRSGAQRAEMLRQQVKTFCELEHCYIPLDVYSIIKKIVGRLQPQARFIMIEDDLWPCLLHTLKTHHHPRLLINYELKGKSKTFYTRFPRAFQLTHQVSTILTLSSSTEQKVKTLLGEQNHSNKIEVQTMGNIKYSKQLLRPQPFTLQAALKPYPKPFQTLIKNQFKPLRPPRTQFLTLASSHPGEETLITAALSPLLKAKTPSVCLIIAPRHIERSSALAKELSGQYNVLLLDDKLLTTNPHPTRSNQALHAPIWKHVLASPRPVEIIIVAKLGLLKILYAISDWVIIGDTFVNGNGGHNILEAMTLGVPVISGGYLRAFSDITPTFEREGVLKRLQSVPSPNEEPYNTPPAAPPAPYSTFFSSLLSSRQGYKQLRNKTRSLTHSLSYNEKLLQTALNKKKPIF